MSALPELPTLPPLPGWMQIHLLPGAQGLVKKYGQACYEAGRKTALEEADWIAADLINNQSKSERHVAAAFKDQIATQDKGE